MSRSSCFTKRILFPAIFVCSFALTGSARPTEVDFDTEVVPLLSKAGCNAASCHGGAAGQAGFRLSLFGGDPEFDYRTIVHELAGRRINHVHPMRSLVLAKPLGELDHGGGELLENDGHTTSTIVRWIESGTPRLKLRKLQRLEIAPKEFQAETVPSEFSLKVTAIFDDGLQRDVTSEAVYVSRNESAIQVDKLGHVTVVGRGRNSAIVRFGSIMETISVTTPINESPMTLPQDARNNFIDDEINETLLALNLAPAETTSDAAFLRRLSLDLTGRLPSLSDAAEFVQTKPASARSDLIDELLRSREFTDYWTHQLATQLRLRKPGTDKLAAEAFHAWLRTQVDVDTSWNKIATALLLSEGNTHKNGQATVHRFFATAREEAEYVTETMMGVRLRCANCHNHPLDVWTQDDYHGLAAIFAGLERGTTVRFTGRGKVVHPRTGSPAIPQIPSGDALDAQSDNRQAFANWLTDVDNPYFAKAMVNRVWNSLMGRGLVTPVDDIRATNPATHPRLLNRLADFFVKNDYKLRPLIRLICNSAAYQRSTAADDSAYKDDRYYSTALSKQLSAEVLADALSDVTGISSDYKGVDRAVLVVDRSTSANELQFLGQCLPGEACSASSNKDLGIASKLHLLNGKLLNDKLDNPDNELCKMLDSHVPTQDIVARLYLRALSRAPTLSERSAWVRRIDDANNPKEKAARCNDFLWALLNCHEFTTNH